MYRFLQVFSFRILNFENHKTIKSTKGLLGKVGKSKLIQQKHERQIRFLRKRLSYLHRLCGNFHKLRQRVFRHYNAKVFCMYMVNHEWNTRVNLLDNTHTVRSVCLTSVCLVWPVLQRSGWSKLLPVNTVTGRAYIGTRVNLHSGCTCARVSSWRISTRVVTPRISIPRFVYV